MTGPSNRFAHAAALAVAEAPARAYNPFFVYGGVGSARPTCCHAIGHFVDSNFPELAYLYVSVETFTNEFINALRDGNIRTFKDRYRSVDVLLIDDIQSLQGREQTQEEFFHTFNALHDSGKQIVICSDRPPKAIATLEDRLRSRFEMGLITDIQPPDLETRIAILRKRVQYDAYQVTTARCSRSSPRGCPPTSRPRGCADARHGARLDLWSAGECRVGREVLQDLYPPDDGIVTIENIQRETCRYFDIGFDEFIGHKRTRRLVTPRQVAMYLSRELTDGSCRTSARPSGTATTRRSCTRSRRSPEQMSDEGEVYSAVRTLTTRVSGTPTR